MGSPPRDSSRTRSRRIRARAWWSALSSVLVFAWILAGAASAWGAKAAPQSLPPAPETPALLSPGDAGEARIWGTVRAVSDGKHLVVVTPELGRLEVRLIGVEPPEPPHPGRDGASSNPGQPFGPEAVKYLRDLVLDKQVQLDVYGKDRSGRTLAVVWLGDISVNRTLVKEGFAWLSPSVPVIKVRVVLEVAARQAQVGKYGLWALPNAEPPWEFRKRHHLPAE